MSTFCAATSEHQSALMVFVFLSLLLCLGNAFALPDRQKAQGLRFLNIGLFLVLFTLEALTGHAFWCIRNGFPCRVLLPLPMWSLWCLAGVSFLLLAAEWEVLRRRRRQGLHRDAVKQAVDALPSGICYFTSEGAVKLCNLQMHRLYRFLTQSDLQALTELRRGLQNCDRQSGVIRLSDALQTYLFPDGRAWRYSETQVTTSDGVCYTEAIFTDVTKQYEYSLELQAQIRRLEQISHDLKQHTFNVQTAARAQELLSAKTTLHDRMGAGVLAVRRILQSGNTAEAAYALELFQDAVHLIKNGNESPQSRGELDSFLHDAHTIGVQVQLSGELPRQEAVSQVFVLAMRECLTNGVRHADASQITVRLTQQEDTATLQITNNGAVPGTRITPKGGLLNLERHVTNLQGRMELQSFPVFMLTLTIPFAKEGV